MKYVEHKSQINEPKLLVKLDRVVVFSMLFQVKLVCLILNTVVIRTKCIIARHF